MSVKPLIVVGDVFYLNCTHCNPPKYKFFVVAQAQPLRMFLINTQPTAFQQARPSHMAAMAVIRVVDHPSFLAYDSYIGCDHLSHEYSHDKLTELLGRDPAARVGSLAPSAVDTVRDALRANDHMPRKYMKQIRPAWGLPE